jgi:hypothetical protein
VKPELLRVSDEADAFNGLLIVETIATIARLSRLLDQRPPLVEPDCLDADAGLFGRAADGHCACNAAHASSTLRKDTRTVHSPESHGKTDC